MNMEVIYTVTRTTSRTGLNFFQALYFHNCLRSFHYYEDRFHINFFIRSSHKWRSYIYSQKLRQVALILTFLFTAANSNQNWKE